MKSIIEMTKGEFIHSFNKAQDGELVAQECIKKMGKDGWECLASSSATEKSSFILFKWFFEDNTGRIAYVEMCYN